MTKTSPHQINSNMQHNACIHTERKTRTTTIKKKKKGINHEIEKVAFLLHISYIPSAIFIQSLQNTSMISFSICAALIIYFIVIHAISISILSLIKKINKYCLRSGKQAKTRCRDCNFMWASKIIQKKKN